MITSLLANRRARLFAICLIHFVAATWYNVSLPVYEAPDEHAHFNVGIWIKENQALPRVPDHLADAQHEIAQPPLYYVLLSWVITPIDTGDFEVVAPFNPHWFDGAGRVVHYHFPSESFPYRGTVLAVHLGRLMSTLMGTCTILFTYGIARRLIPKSALLAIALIAFNPQFAFMSGTINNDNLVITGAAATLYLAVSILTGDKWRSWSWFALLGSVWGATALAKLGGLGLGAIVGLVLLYVSLEEKRLIWPRLLGWGVALSAGFLATAGWWLWRNFSLYGDVLGWPAVLTANEALLRPETLSYGQAIEQSTFLYRSFWMLFAYNLLGPESYYVGINLILLAAAAGAAIFFTRGRWRSVTSRQAFSMFLLFLWSVITYGLLVRWIRLTFFSNVGRLLMPILPAAAVFLALGLSQYRGKLRWVPRAAVVFLGAWALLGPLLIIRPAFAIPGPLDSAAEIPNKTAIRIEDDMVLIGYELAQDRWQLGDEVILDLYWRPLRPIEESYILAPRLIDSKNEVVSAYDTVPAGGRYPTPMWQPNVVFAERHVLPPIADHAAPGLARLVVDIYPAADQNRELSVKLNGQPIERLIYLADGKIRPVDSQKAVAAETLATFSSLAALVEVAPVAVDPNQVEVAITWQAIGETDRDFQIFAFLIDADGNLTAQADGPPGGGAFPTSIWEPGDIVRENRVFSPPAGEIFEPGTYAIVLGFYLLEDGSRLPAQRPDGLPFENNQVPAKEVTIEAGAGGK